MEGTKGQVNTEKRRVYLFIAVGLLTAAAVGYGVWRASTPSTPSASDIATATAEVSTNSDTAGQIVPTPAPEESGISTESTPPAPAVVATDDPYLAPNAVVQSAPTDIGPTVVYRPENIMDTPATTEPATTEPATAEPATGQPTPTPTATGAGAVSGSPEHTGAPTTPPEPEQTQPTTTPQAPTPAPGTPAPAEPETPEPAAPATAQTQTPEAPESPATPTPQPAPAGSSLPD